MKSVSVVFGAVTLSLGANDKMDDAQLQQIETPPPHHPPSYSAQSQERSH